MRVCFEDILKSTPFLLKVFISKNCVVGCRPFSGAVFSKLGFKVQINTPYNEQHEGG